MPPRDPTEATGSPRASHPQVGQANKDGRTALMWACKNGEVQVVTELIHQYAADVSARMKDDSTAFDWAGWQREWLDGPLLKLDPDEVDKAFTTAQQLDTDPIDFARQDQIQLQI